EPLFGGDSVRLIAAGGSNRRANDASKLRRDAALAQLQATQQNMQHPTNGDEDLCPNKMASYSKGLPHNDNGTVVLSAYDHPPAIFSDREGSRSLGLLK